MRVLSYNALRMYAILPPAFRRFFVICCVLIVLNLISISRFLYSQPDLFLQWHWRDLFSRIVAVFLLVFWLYGLIKARRLGLIMSDFFMFSPFLGWGWEAMVQVRELFSNIEKKEGAHYLLFIWYALVLLLCGFVYRRYVWKWWLAQRKHLVSTV